jgi:hypothetical protein
MYHIKQGSGAIHADYGKAGFTLHDFLLVPDDFPCMSDMPIMALWATLNVQGPDQDAVRQMLIHGEHNVKFKLFGKVAVGNPRRRPTRTLSSIVGWNIAFRH